MGYFKNELVARQVEVGDRRPMVYVSATTYWWTFAGVWLMAALTGFLIGVWF